jgi:hypothetical protein
MIRWAAFHATPIYLGLGMYIRAAPMKLWWYATGG